MLEQPAAIFKACVGKIVDMLGGDTLSRWSLRQWHHLMRAACVCHSAEGKFRHLESSKGVVGIETRKDKDT